MKRIIIIFVAIITCLSCYHRLYRERIPFGVVYLHVLKEDGTPFKDEEAERFLLQCWGQHNDIKTVINENDDLIFRYPREFAIYREGDEITDGDLLKALTSDEWFAIKDKAEEYKTVKKTYRECYKYYKKNLNPRRTYSTPDYIYHCEVRLERKK